MIKNFLSVFASLSVLIPSTIFAQQLDLGSISVQNPTSSDTITIDLDDVFRRDSDGSFDMRYSLEGTDNSILSSQLDSNSGHLTIRFKEGTNKTVNLRAHSRFTKDFPVYDSRLPEFYDVSWPDLTSLGVKRAHLLTHWSFFQYTGTGADGQNFYDETKFLEEKFRETMANIQLDSPNMPVILDIESNFLFNPNTASGRTMLGKVAQIAQELRPDINTIGYYRLMPWRNWQASASYNISKDHKNLNLLSSTVQRYDERQRDYERWVAHNSIMRTEELGSDAKGGTLASKVDIIYPSLYTFYRDRAGYGAYREATIDAETGYFSVTEFGYPNGAPVTLFREADKSYPLGFANRTYYVVNGRNGGLQFQLSETPNGAPVIGKANDHGKIILSRQDTGRPMIDDLDVLYWPVYAAENVKEARKFGKKVIPFISPSYNGAGRVYIEEDFFFEQLNTLRKISDGVVLFDMLYQPLSFHYSSDWYRALTKFMKSMEPRTVQLSLQVNVPASNPPVDDGPEGEPDDPITPEITPEVPNNLSGNDFMTLLGNYGRATSNSRIDLNQDGMVTDADMALFVANFRPEIVGDKSGDGQITPRDLILCRQETQVSRTCDMNNDGVFNALDENMLSELYGSVLGDISGDGKVTSTDIITCYQNFTGNQKLMKTYEQCDVTGDGRVNLEDIGIVLASAFSRCDEHFLTCSSPNTAAAKIEEGHLNAPSSSKFQRKLKRSKRQLKKLKALRVSVDGQKIPRKLRRALKAATAL